MSLRLSAMAAIGRMYPLYSGNYQIVNSRIGRALTRSSETAWCPSPGGEMIVPLSDEVGRCIYFTGDYDRKLTWLCRKLVRPGDTVIDVGANLGLVTLTLAKCVGSSGRVHAFEPNPVLQNLLDQSLRRNSISNVTLHKVALGSERGELELFVPRYNSGQGSFVYHSNTPERSSYHCAVERLADVVSAAGISDIRLVKIDVEGFENAVLLGSSEVLRRMRPLIIIETNEQNQPAFRDRAAIKTLRSFSYRFLAIPKALLKMSIQIIDADDIKDPGHDVIAIADEQFETAMEILRT